MRQNHRLFWTAEIILAMLAGVLLMVMFTKETRQRQVAVIVSDSDAGSWERFLSGIKQGAYENNLRIVITGTDVIRDAQEERQLIAQEIAGGADALIVQPVPGEDTLHILRDVSGDRPLVLVRDRIAEDEAALPTMAPDGEEMGRQLGNMAIADYGGSLAGKTIGILSGSYGTTLEQAIYTGLMRPLAESGAEILWTQRVEPVEETITETLVSQAAVDLVLALDTRSLEAAGTAAGDHNLHGAVVYGVGASKAALYHLDRGEVAGLVIANDYDMGYLAITEIASSLQHPLYEMDSYEVLCGCHRAEDLFLADHADYLFSGAN